MGDRTTEVNLVLAIAKQQTKSNLMQVRFTIPVKLCRMWDIKFRREVL